MSHDTRHDHDGDDCSDPQPEVVIPSRYYMGNLQLLDIIGVGFRTFANVLNGLVVGSHMMANEFLNAGAHRRMLEDQLRSRLEADFALRQWVNDPSGVLTAEDDS